MKHFNKTITMTPYHTIITSVFLFLNTDVRKPLIGFSIHTLFIRSLVISIAVLFSLAGCKKDDEIKPITEPQPKVTANAGADKSTKVAQAITLDGSASKDSQGKTLEYTWALVKSPVGSAVVFIYPQPGQATFTANTPGEYEVELTVKSTNGQAKDQVLVTVTPADLITLSGEITTDRVLENINPDPTKADYLVIDNLILKAKLTVKPGVVIEFEQDKGLHIYPQGALVAKGTMQERVVFTGKSKTAGFWKGILFESNSPINELDYATVVYGGSSSYIQLLSDTKANVALAGTTLAASALKVSHTNFAFSGGYGLFVQGMSELSAFSTNVFSRNTGGAIYVPARQVHKLDAASVFTGNNGIDGVETGGVINLPTEVTWPDFSDGGNYFVSNDITVQSGLKIAVGATLEFREGLVLLVEGAGYLNATGTATNKIIFTARTRTGALNWGGILFSTAHEQNKLQHTEVSYAGNKEVPGFGDLKANIAVANTGKAYIGQTSITIVAYMNEGAQINADVVSVNTYSNLPGGNVKLSSITEPAPTLTGEWLDQWSFNNRYAFDDKFYDRQANRWFRGATTPWNMNPKSGFGLKINEDGNYIWTIAEHGPQSCVNSYSAEYITGKVTASGNNLTFQESYWRTKFYAPCNNDSNVDMDVQPGGMTLQYKIERVYDVFTGEPSWQLKIFNPDGTSFTYYKR
jgi:uncharacterized lipoprotein NlpE involved in copper resistance